MLTIPAFGTRESGLAFVKRHSQWLEEQMKKIRARQSEAHSCKIGTLVLLHGEPTPIRLDTSLETPRICVGQTPICDWPGEGHDLQPLIETGLWQIACDSLPLRVAQLNAVAALPVKRVTVRNQRSRWGSCSRRGTISLNWRLIQVPPFVRDYIIIHELTHLRHMNHSNCFWQDVDRACPGWKSAETWLRQNSRLLK